MPKIISEQELDAIVAIVEAYPDGVQAKTIRDESELFLHQRVLQRRLALLAKQNRLIVKGRGRGSRYFPIRQVVAEPVVMLKLNELIDQADELKSVLDNFRDWDQKTVQEALNIEYTFDSNRIEGNTLTLRETDLVVHKGLTVGGKPLVEHLEAVNHYEAVKMIRDFAQQKKELTSFFLSSLHSLVLSGIDTENAGKFRQVPVMISGSQHTPPQPWQLDKLMEDYFHFYHENRESLHPIILAAELHEQLVTIHPFIDGNGRTARLVMNLILLQHGFPIAIIHGDTEARLAYYAALEKCNLEQDKEDFHYLIAGVVIESQKRLLQLIGKLHK